VTDFFFHLQVLVNHFGVAQPLITSWLSHRQLSIFRPLPLEKSNISSVFQRFRLPRRPPGVVEQPIMASL
jgi:hypothetical protein